MMKRFSIKLSNQNEPYLRIYIDSRSRNLKVYHSQKSWLFNGKLEDFEELENFENKDKILDQINFHIPPCTHPKYKTPTGINCHGECEFCNFNPWKPYN